MRRKTMKFVLLSAMAFCFATGGSLVCAASTETGEIKLSDEMKEISSIYSFKIDGEEYQLPCKLTDFIDNGWTLSSEEFEEFSSESADKDSCHLYKKTDKEYIPLILGVYVLSGGNHTEEDLYVGEVSVNEGQGVEMEMNGLEIGSDASLIDETFKDEIKDKKDLTDTNGRGVHKLHFLPNDTTLTLLGETYDEYAEFVIDKDTNKIFQIVLSYYPLFEE